MQLLTANGRRSGGRHIDSAVNDAARGSTARSRAYGLVFEKGESRPTSLLHFFASSSLIAAARADGVILLVNLLALLCAVKHFAFSACVAWMKMQ